MKGSAAVGRLRRSRTKRQQDWASAGRRGKCPAFPAQCPARKASFCNGKSELCLHGSGDVCGSELKVEE